MVTRLETLKKYVKTVIDQLPAYIAEYPLEDQPKLNEFRSTLYLCESKAHIERKPLIDQISKICQEIKARDEYIHLPFYFFIVDYFFSANRLLSVTDYHAQDFYEYLGKYLRKNPEMSGAFQLIREKTPLSDSKWEILQYACNKPPPVEKDDIQVLEVVHSSILEINIHSLNPLKLKTIISQQVESFNTMKVISRFFTLLECLWNLQFSLQAFNLTRIYCHFQLSEHTTLSEIIDFNNTTNTTLVSSDVYKVRNFYNTFIALLVVPDKLKNRLQTYLTNLEYRGKLALHEFRELDNIRISSTFTLYKEKEGWQELSTTKRKRLSKKLTTKHPRKRKNSEITFFLTPSLNSQWNSRMHEDKSRLIALFCKTSRGYSFNDLILGFNETNAPHYFSKKDISLLKDLISRKVASIGFIPSRLISDFSLDRYWVKIPKIPFYQLSRLLNILPFCQIYYSEEYYYLWTVLTPALVQWIKRDLKWIVMPITLNHSPRKLVPEWFNKEELRWTTPQALKE